MKKIPFGLLFFALIAFLFSFTPGKEKQLKVALSKASPNYINWILKGDPAIIVVDLGNLKPAEAIRELQECEGLVLTGGGDIDPSLYGNADKEKYCKDIDPGRDSLENALTGEALARKIPILGICRGEQMLNVFFGGSLIRDIPLEKKLKDGATDEMILAIAESTVADHFAEKKLPVTKEPAAVIHQCDDYLHCYHSVRLDSASLLYSIMGIDTGFVTTNHHQAAKMLGKGLRKNAQSADGIVEGIEWTDARGKSFMIGVQWHPERMDTSNAFSGKLLQRFIAEAKKYYSTIQKEK
jgi:putative glutamine amidotransferase